MLRMVKTLSVVTALSASLVLASCDSVGEVTQPLSPGEASLAKGGNGKSKGKGAEMREKKGPKVKGKDRNGKEKEFKLAVRSKSASSNHASGWVDGSEDVVLQLKNHYILIPAGAVDGPTQFRMSESQQQVNSDLAIIALDLKATRWVDGAEVNVGAEGFAADIEVCVSYAETVDDYTTADVSGASILWLQNAMKLNSEMQRVDSSRGASEVVCALTDHFSMYGLGWP